MVSVQINQIIFGQIIKPSQASCGSQFTDAEQGAIFGVGQLHGTALDQAQEIVPQCRFWLFRHWIHSWTNDSVFCPRRVCQRQARPTAGVRQRQPYGRKEAQKAKGFNRRERRERKEFLFLCGSNCLRALPLLAAINFSCGYCCNLSGCHCVCEYC